MNAIHCLNCGEVVESKNRHDYKSCSCPPMCRVSVDGGSDYNRRGFGDRSRWMEILDDGSEDGPFPKPQDDAAEAQQYAKRMNPRKDDTNEPKDQSDGESPRREDR